MLVKSNIRTEIQEFLKLAVPLASAQVAQAATGFVDTLMMGIWDRKAWQQVD
jgi:MATE family multidrug resistance protein